jgi:hypothetical protein
VKLATVRHVTVSEPLEALPRHPALLAPPKQGVPPCAADLTAEAVQSPEIAWDRVVVEVALHHTVQPLPDLGDGLVPPHQGSSNGRQRRAHPLLRRQANDLEPSLSVRSTAVREPEKVERLRMLLSPFAAILRGKSTKLNQSGLVGMQL